MQTVRDILIKTGSKPMQQIYIRESLMDRSLLSSMHSLSTTPLIALPCFPLFNWKTILHDTLVHMQPEILNIVTFKMFKTKF